MDREDFKANVADVSALLKGLQKLIPNRVDDALIAYLDRLSDDPVGLELLRNVMHGAK